MGEEYYVQDGRGCVGNSVLWWAIGGHGYTCDLRKAWRVSEEKALQLSRSRNTDIAWPCGLIDERVESHFDSEKLRGLTPLMAKGMKLETPPTASPVSSLVD
jgi:hypothetical protein